MNRRQECEEERARLAEVFAEAEDGKKKLIAGLIDDAAFLYAENAELRKMMEDGGMVKTHPKNPSLQKTSEAAKQYLKNVNTYSVVIKALNAVLMRLAPDEDDEFDNWIKEKRETGKDVGDNAV